jgi:MFS transporter, DHA1 family, tetracycline resistance protein
MRKSSLFPIFLVYFLDTLSFAVVFPLFSSLILTTQFNIIPFSDSLSMRTAMLGILNASFPLALLIGAPIMGDLSDHFGRKRTFLVTVSATIIANLMTGIAIYFQTYSLLLVSRFLCGFFSGNLTLCLAAISDLSPNAKARAKHFGSLTAIGGLSWVLAMIAGGGLSLPELHPRFSPPLPFWIVSGIGIFNLVILYFLFQETHPTKNRTRLRLSPILHHIAMAYRAETLRPLYIVQIFLVFGWLFVFQWFSGYSVVHYHRVRDITAISLSIIGIFWILGAAVLNRFLVQHFPLKKIPLYGLFLLTLLLFSTSYLTQYWVLVALDCLIALIVSLTSANIFSLISLHAPGSVQGKIMGLSQSVVTIGQFTAPVVGSFISLQNVPLLYRIAAFSTLVGFLLYQSTHKGFKK